MFRQPASQHTFMVNDSGHLSCEVYIYHAAHDAGGNCRIHDLFGGAGISRICNAYFLPKVFLDPQIWEYVR